MLRGNLVRYSRAAAVLLVTLLMSGSALCAGSVLPVSTVQAAPSYSATAALDCGYFHTLLVTTNGTLWAWGSNSYGQLGLGDKSTRMSPAQVGTATNWKAVAASWYDSLGVRSDGTLWAWGDNRAGQLGLGNRVSKSSPTQVGTATNWVAVAAGQEHSLGLRSDGTLWAWGNNSYGQLGTSGGTSPTRVGTATDWVSIAAGDVHSLGVRSDGTLWAWGWGDAYQLGVGDANARTTPTRVGTATDWVSVASDFRYSMGIRRDGSLWAWGWNTQAELGVGDVVNRPVPTRVGEATNWSAVYPARAHCLGIQSDGSLWGWGSNYDGELGVGDIQQRVSPARVYGSAWAVAAAGDAFSAGVRADGVVCGWGRNEIGQLGLGPGKTGARNRPEPCDMPAMDWPPTVNTTAASRILGSMATLNGYLYSLGTGSTTAQVSFEWGKGTSYGQTTPAREMTATGPYSEGLSGLEPDTWYHFRAKVEGSSGTSYGADSSFKTTTASPTAPDVTTVDASNVTGSAARLNGTLAGMGTAESVIVSFEYGTAQGVYTRQTDNDTITRAGAFYADVTGLASGTTYYFRARASGDGQDLAGELVFTTTGTPKHAPQVETGEANQLTTASARLNGNLTNMGTATNVTVFFEWGETPGSYTLETPAAGKTSTGAFFWKLEGLSAGRTYYYRAKVVGDGTGYGAEKRFTVPAVVPEPTLISPNGAGQGQTATVTVTGDAFTNCIGLDLGPGITVDNFTVVSANRITAQVTLDPGLALGPRNVTVNTANGSYVLEGGFVVKGPSSGGFPVWGWAAIAAAAILVCGGALFLVVRRRHPAAE